MLRLENILDPGYPIGEAVVETGRSHWVLDPFYCHVLDPILKRKGDVTQTLVAMVWEGTLWLWCPQSHRP